MGKSLAALLLSIAFFISTPGICDRHDKLIDLGLVSAFQSLGVESVLMAQYLSKFWRTGHRVEALKVLKKLGITTSGIEIRDLAMKTISPYIDHAALPWGDDVDLWPVNPMTETKKPSGYSLREHTKEFYANRIFRKPSGQRSRKAENPTTKNPSTQTSKPKTSSAKSDLIELDFSKTTK
ncbi:MAG: hypothetical protein EBQ92_01965 [Proteobacteria bacterium]|nr:hypothetical protein [Pseudomonadota bacterium]